MERASYSIPLYSLFIFSLLLSCKRKNGSFGTITRFETRVRIKKKKRRNKNKNKGWIKRSSKRIIGRSILQRDFHWRGKGMPVTGEVVRLLMIRLSVSSSSISVPLLLAPEYKCRVFILITRRLAFKPSHRYRPSSSLFLLFVALCMRAWRLGVFVWPFVIQANLRFKRVSLRMQRIHSELNSAG